MGFGKDHKGVIIRDEATITLGTLAQNVAVAQASPIALTEDFRLVKLAELVINADNFATAGDFVDIGIASGELTVAEIGEALNLSGPLDRNDRLGEERASRPVWILATIGAGSDLPNDGVPMEKTIRWTFSNPEGFQFFAYNRGPALTTGGIIRLGFKAFGVWVS